MRIPIALPVALLLFTGTCAPAPGDDSSTDVAQAARASSTTEAAEVPSREGRVGLEAAPGASGDHAHDDRASATGPAAGPATEHSLYHLAGRWRNQDGREISLADLGGRIQVVAMVYTHCTFACPRILAQMKAIEGRLSPDALGEVGFVLVSIDPERDTPDRLRTFADDTRLDTDRWTLLNGNDGDVLALSVLLGVKYRAEGDGEFAHSNVLTVLDRDGRIIERVEGLNAELASALDAIEGAR